MVAETHLIRLPHVAVEDSSHALDCRMLQLMSPAHIIVNAPGEQSKHHRMTQQYQLLKALYSTVMLWI